jgi:hemerythrin superfamily protein
MSAVRSHFLQDHKRIEHLLEVLRDAVEGAEAPTIQEVWSRFEQCLMRHMEAEERYLLPFLRVSRPLDAEIIERDHKEIRQRVAELGVCCDLHLLRKQRADELMSLLEAHAAWEDKTFYRILDELASSSSESGLGARFAMALGTLADPDPESSPPGTAARGT